MTAIEFPVAGVDYPRTFQEFDARFSTEEGCCAHVFRMRWASGFKCPHCKAVADPWKMSDGWLKCRGCRRRTSVTAGTVFEGTRKPLRTWFLAMWFVTSQKFGANALGLQRVLGFGSYQTAWAWLHKMRRAMVRPGRERLFGPIEVDETYVGGREKGFRGRATERKAIVAVAAEVRGKGMGRIRLRRVADASEANLVPFVTDVAEPGSAVHTDDWNGYNGLGAMGFKHHVTNLKQSGSKAHEVMPGVHRVASLLKRWLLGTLQGGVQHFHLDYYLDEFTFRFNRRTSRSRGLLFHRLLQQAVQTAPVPYRRLVRRKAGEHTTKPAHDASGQRSG